MNVDVERLDQALVVIVTGEIDLQTSGAMRTVLMDEIGTHAPVLVDLAGVDYIDSSGVASLIEAFQITRKSGQGFVLASASPAVMRVLKLARLTNILPLAKDRAGGLGILETQLAH
jgi:anti-sigma B factor antagonist